MKQNQNQFSGKDIDKSMALRLPAGSTFNSIDTGKTYVIGEKNNLIQSGLGNPPTIEEIGILNDRTVGLQLDVSKENIVGTGFTSDLYGINSIAIGKSVTRVVNINAVRAQAEHVGTGQTYFITGVTGRGVHNGSGTSDAVYGSFAEAKVIGTGTGSHNYVVGNNVVSKVDNPNANVNQLQGQHVAVKLDDGTVNQNLIVQLLDVDSTGGTITGDLSYLRIQNDTIAASVGGTARSIYSLSTLPSEFAGSIKAASLIDTGVTEHANNAAAITAGLATGTHYRTGDALKIVH